MKYILLSITLALSPIMLSAMEKGERVLVMEDFEDLLADGAIAQENKEVEEKNEAKGKEEEEEKDVLVELPAREVLGQGDASYQPSQTSSGAFKGLFEGNGDGMNVFEKPTSKNGTWDSIPEVEDMQREGHNLENQNTEAMLNTLLSAQQLLDGTEMTEEEYAEALEKLLASDAVSVRTGQTLCVEQSQQEKEVERARIEYEEKQARLAELQEQDGKNKDKRIKIHKALLVVQNKRPDLISPELQERLQQFPVPEEASGFWNGVWSRMPSWKNCAIM